ncbi:MULTISPECIES: DUF2929 family protein [Amphibacillus]|uniref:DUF2929 family protein n=1 Tax=Amphibacillus TaxID=29331 RepID=UPI0002D4CC48|nr:MULTISPECIES: DUF2929 family protein [Amphibacillus]MBM7540160.1 hypothetical protein [Amphibacillus cookii]
MRFIITALWSFAISLVLGYVLTSMGGYEFEIIPVLGMTIVFSLVGFLVGEKLIDKH